jgi:hypothetical protein
MIVGGWHTIGVVSISIVGHMIYRQHIVQVILPHFHENEHQQSRSKISAIQQEFQRIGEMNLNGVDVYV